MWKKKNVRLHYSVLQSRPDLCFIFFLKASLSLKTNSVLPFYSAMMPIFPVMSDPQIYSLLQVDLIENFHASHCWFTLRWPQDFCVLCVFFPFSCKCYLCARDPSNSPKICKSGGAEPLKHTQVWVQSVSLAACPGCFPAFRQMHAGIGCVPHLDPAWR